MKAYLYFLCYIGFVPAALSLLRPVGHRYFVNKTKVTWPNAQKSCRKTYEDLATIESQLDWLRLNTEIARKGLTSIAWIGLYNQINSWRWSFNETYLVNVYENWLGGEPDNTNGDQSCGVSGPVGFWSDFSCTELYPIICYDANDPKKFVGVTTKMTWSDGKDYCRMSYTDLAIITSAKENALMQTIAAHQGRSWIGLYRDTWKWSDGTNASNVLWKTGQPDNLFLKENCADITKGEFEDVLCTKLSYFICHITHPVSERQILRLQVKSDVNMIASDVQSAMLELIKQKIDVNGMLTNTTVTWRVRSDGQIFYKKSDLNFTCV